MADKPPEDDQSMICGVMIQGKRHTVRGVRTTGFKTPMVVEGEGHDIADVEGHRSADPPPSAEKRPVKYFSGWSPPKPDKPD
jgi:hypothetical protein